MNAPVHNLTFHGLGHPPHALTDGERSLWIAPAAFHRFLDLLAARDDVRITFDDGNRSDIDIALPALLARKLTAEFFLCAHRLHQPGFVNEHDARALVNAGMAVGLHGAAHRSWRGISDDDLRTEIADAQHSLRAVTAQPVLHAACPFGQYDRRALAALRAAAFTRVYTSDGGAADPHAWLQARTSITARDSPASLQRLLQREPAHKPIVRRVKQTIKAWR